MKHIKTFNKLFESSYLEKDFAIDNLFNKYQIELETKEDSYSKAGLKKSMELIGPGKVEAKDNDNDYFQYTEMMMNNRIIFVVHGRIRHPVMTYGYGYEIGVYLNDPRTQQIGGGYGASGIMSVEHTRILHYVTAQRVCQNMNIISKVCADIKKEIENSNIK